MPITMTPIKAGRPRVTLEDIPEDVTQAVEDAYVFCQTSDDRLDADFGTEDAAETFLSQARSYAYQRPAGRLVVTGNSTQKGHARFRVTPYVAPIDGGPDPTGAEET